MNKMINTGLTRTVGLVLVSLGVVGLTACDSPSTVGSSTGEGRTRLSVNDSYGEFGEYVVHVNGMTATGLTPEVAQAYNIVRSEDRGVVNLVVLRKSENVGVSEPVTAVVEVSAANLTGQLKAVEVREIIDAESIYYICEVTVDNRETINFDFDIRPENGTRVLPVRFTHQFYAE